MKKIKTLQAIALVFITLLSYGQTTFLKTIGKSQSDIGYCIIPTMDSAFVVGGYFDSQGSGQPDFFIAKINQPGDTLWTKIINTGNSSYLKSIVQTDDSGFICLGFRYNFNYDINLFKLDKNGNLLWEKKYGGAKNEIANSLTDTKDSGFAFCGYTSSYGGSNLNMYVVKTNNMGDTIWTKVFSTDTIENLISIINTPDNGFLVAGQTWGYGVGEGDALVMKLDSMGNIEWTKTYGGRWDEIFYCVCKTSDGNYILAGNTESWWGGVVTDTTVHPPFSKQDYYVVKIKPDGDTLWTRTYGGAVGVGFESPYSVDELPDGNFLIGGRASSFVTSTDAYLLTINPQGDVVRSTLITGSSTDVINGMTARKDGSVVLTGYTNSFGNGQEDILIAAVDVNSQVGCFDTTVTTIVGNTYTVVLSGFNPMISNGGILDTTGFIMLDSNKIVTEVCGCNISPTISGPDSACNGTLTTIKAAGGKYYQWSNGTTADSVSFTITSDTVFSVTVSNDSCSALVSHKVIAIICLGINENKFNNNYEISVFPNPTNEVVYLNVKERASNKQEKYCIELFNYLGQKLSVLNLHEGQNTIDVSSFNTGIYLYKIKLVANNEMVGYGKIMKQD